MLKKGNQNDATFRNINAPKNRVAVLDYVVSK